MDITIDPKRKRRKSGHTSEKSVQDKPIENSNLKDNDMFYVDEKAYKMPPDLKNLPEFDWNNPENQKILKTEEEVRIKKYGKLTPGTIYPALKYLRENKLIKYKQNGRKKVLRFCKKNWTDKFLTMA